MIAAETLSFVKEVHASPLGMPIGSQVYPHRQRIREGDFAGLLRDMREIGIGQVELDSPGYADSASLVDGKQTRRILDDHEMKCPSIHYTLEELRTKQEFVIEWAKQIGATQVSTASLEGKAQGGITTMDEIKRAADEYNQIAAVMHKAGLLQTLHDEGFELSTLEDGRLTYQVLLDLLDKDMVKMQFQISAMRVVGDPIMYFNKYPGRFASMHLQGVDLKAPMPTPGARKGGGGGRQGRGGRGGSPQLAVGHDSLDWKAIFTAAKTGGLTNYFVEQSWDLTVQSVAYLKTLDV
jgi:sugar phosphate isomerase/epimerase